MATQIGTPTSATEPRATTDARRVERRTRWIALGAFLAIGLALVLTHEPWRDEIQAWLIARNSDSLGALIRNSRAEGHPLLWYLLLWVPARFTRDLLAMQLLHLAIAAAAVACVLWRAPFPRWQRLAFTFGYFPVYEYSAIARNYALGMLLLFVGCMLATRRPRPYVRLVLVIVLMGSTSAYGLVLGAALGSAVALDDFVRRRWYGEDPPWRRIGVAAGVLVVGAALVVAQSAPALSSPGARGFTNAIREDRVRGALAPFAGLFPIPSVETRFWGTSIVDGLVNGPVRAVLGLVLLALLAWCLRGRIAALWLWLVGASALFALGLQGYQGFTRHAGHFFLLFVAACWLLPSLALWREGHDPSARRAGGLGLRWADASRALGVLLLVHLVASVVPIAAELTHPFSGAHDMAELLARKGYGDAELVLWPEFEGIAVVAELDRSGYLPALGRRARDQEWGSPRHHTTDRDVARLARRLCRDSPRPVVLITTSRARDPEFALVGQVTDTIVDSEQYFAYRVRSCAPRDR